MKPEDKQRIEEAAIKYSVSTVKMHKDPMMEEGLRAYANEDFKAGATYEHNYLTTQVVEAERKWISVKDRLPEPGQKVLVSFIGGLTGIPLIKIDYRVKYHNNTEWKNTYDNAVTHWQPLPEPPEE